MVRKTSDMRGPGLSSCTLATGSMGPSCSKAISDTVDIASWWGGTRGKKEVLLDPESDAGSPKMYMMDCDCTICSMLVVQNNLF